jgi:hypothetical protein
MVPPVKKAPLLDLRVERGGPGPLQRPSTRLRYRVAQDVVLLKTARRSAWREAPIDRDRLSAIRPESGRHVRLPDKIAANVAIPRRTVAASFLLSPAA